jgi:hypothetical protein
VYVSQNIIENKIFFNRKTSGPGPRVGRPGGTMVHGGPWARMWQGLAGELAVRCHMAPKLTARAPMARGGFGEPHRWNGGRRGGLTRLGNDETKWWQTEVNATTNGVRRRGEKESVR